MPGTPARSRTSDRCPDADHPAILPLIPSDPAARTPDDRRARRTARPRLPARRGASPRAPVRRSRHRPDPARRRCPPRRSPGGPGR
ncbi:hypothetical protein F0U44_20640 [Nocardioides humilatus]|uniref:Uncharacterized protein n=1 Tax=Nocardioides humilatus TaxID=2607660 RepID=A0A5B1L4H2_9ACTN|nr:hypothetical protein F0U44_20640 [Nocardioides humilatus]